MRPDVTVIGGGLAGCEAAWQLAERGARVALVEMKPVALSPAHRTPLLCELVCSNSLRSDDPEAPAGLLKAELRRAGSMVIASADRHRVPAGDALAVERVDFGREVTTRLALHPNVRLERRVLDELPDGPVIMATGPLTGGRLARQVRELLGGERLYFYDAIAPIVEADTIDWEHAFRASRWDRDAPGRAPRRRGRTRPGAPSAGGAASGASLLDEGQQPGDPGPGRRPGGERSEGSSRRAGANPADDEAQGDYVNCPLSADEYYAFVRELRAGRKVVPHRFEEPKYFEGCLPIEVMADRGDDVLAHGPMRPVGLVDPRTGKRPFAVVQLRPENRWGTAYNLVGFQTRLAYPEQKRIFRMIPALRQAEFVRFGSIHRNSYIDSPRLLGPELELVKRPDVRFAGQITGVEGYIESLALGWLVARFVAGRLAGRPVPPPPPTTAIGGLYAHVRGALGPFAPTNVNFGLLPPPPPEAKVRKKDRRAWLTRRALADWDAWLAAIGGAGVQSSPSAAC